MIIEASRKKRLINFIIDLITVALLMELTFRVEVFFENPVPIKILRIIIIFGGYYIPLEYFFGKTLGKVLTQTKVVNKKGGKISFQQSALRFLCRWMPYNYLPSILGDNEKPWHDVASKTRVIDEKGQKEMMEIISDE